MHTSGRSSRYWTSAFRQTLEWFLIVPFFDIIISTSNCEMTQRLEYEPYGNFCISTDGITQLFPKVQQQYTDHTCLLAHFIYKRNCPTQLGSGKGQAG